MNLIKYKADFSFLDERNIIRRRKKETVEAHSILEAAIILQKTYHIIRIRSIKEKEELQECILNKYPNPPESRKLNFIN